MGFYVFFRLAAQGFRPKYFLLLFGFAAIYLLIHRHYALSGASAAAAAGFWQFGIVFPVIVAIGAYRGDGGESSHSPRRGYARRRVGRTVVGMAGATALIVLPIILSGATVPMLTQVVLGPLTMTEPFRPLQRIKRIEELFGVALPVMAIGGIGAFFSRRTAWWVPIGTGWAVLQVSMFDLTLYADLFLLVAFCGVGYGLFMYQVNEHIVPFLLVVGIVVFVIAQFMVGGGSLAIQPQSVPSDGSWKYERGTPEWYFWTQPELDTCHIWRSSPEQRLTRALGGSLSDAECRYSVWRWWRTAIG
jgi:hypothetical protein